MLSPDFFWSTLIENDFRFFSGVPCSILKPVLKNIPQDVTYINAAREDSALGLASGVVMAGGGGGILIQNSGLGNIINALTSFNLIYEIPVLLVITWRGYSTEDAPEHLIMGKAMTSFLKTMEIPYQIISEEFEEQVKWAKREMRNKKIPVALLLKRGTIE